jgi:hypothetical protein
VAELDFNVALRLAGALTTVGHPFREEAIEATALLLVRLCKGAVIDGRQWTPRQQAQAMVDEIVSTWEWPERGGTKALQELYYAKYAGLPAGAPVLSPDGALQRGLLAKPCKFCEPSAAYCEYGGARAHQKQKEIAEAFAATPALPIPRVQKLGQKPPDHSVMRNVVVPITDIDSRFRESRAHIQAQIQDAEATLKSPEATGEQKEIARMTIDAYTFKRPKKAKARYR